MSGIPTLARYTGATSSTGAPLVVPKPAGVALFAVALAILA